MSANYNQIRSMKGMAIGTILPWGGALTQIPKGWLLCDGTFKNNTEYPLLYSSIGNSYGSGTGTFRLPEVGSRALSDMKNDNAYIPSGTPSVFTSLIGANTSNANNTTYTSTIDLVCAIDDNISSTAGYTGVISSITPNPPAIFESVIVAERKLGDMHVASHSHTGGYSSVSKQNAPQIESCQNGAVNGPFNGCGPFGWADCCATITTFACELNWTSNSVNALYKNSLLGGYPLGGSGNERSFNAQGSINTNSPPRINDAPKNWLGNSDDTVLKTDPYNWPTTLSGDFYNWGGVNAGVTQLTGHGHADINYSINTGGFRAPTSVTVSDIQTGNVVPANANNQSILTYNANVETASLTITYIIKAY